MAGRVLGVNHNDRCTEPDVGRSETGAFWINLDYTSCPLKSLPKRQVKLFPLDTFRLPQIIYLVRYSSQVALYRDNKPTRIT